MNISILGAGAWGTALALAFAPRHRVTLWAFEPGHADEMRVSHENTRFLPGVALPESLVFTATISSALKDSDLAIIATPMLALRTTLATVAHEKPELPVLWVCKGLEAGTGLLPHQVAAQVFGTAPCGAHGALTGPSFADEVARGLPTAITLTSQNAAFAARMARELNTPMFRLYAGDDVAGAEIGGAVKNVLAIATGICDGLGLGLNARAALMTRGLAEITRLGVALGARRETFMGLAGLGDLVLTCTGDLSRNRRVGLALAAGKGLPDIQRELGHVAEGVPTTREVAQQAARLGVAMPITDAVCAVLDGTLTPQAAVAQFMYREPGTE